MAGTSHSGEGMAVFIILLPFAAMQVTNEIDWTANDFIVFGAMLALAGGTLELGTRVSGSGFHRGALGVAVAAGFLLILVNLAVGFLGDEGNPANLMFLGVLGVAVIGALCARGRSAGMAKAMVATAVCQILVGVVGLAGGFASPGGHGVYEVVMGTTLFAGLWLLSAWLFRKAAERAV